MLFVRSEESASTRLFIWAITQAKDASRLAPAEKTWLASWLTEQSFEGNWNSIQTVQFSNKEAGSALFNSRPQSVQNAIKGALRRGLLERVHQGIKGHSSLYVIMPLENGVNARVDSKDTSENSNKVKPCFDPREENRVKGGSQWGQMERVIGSSTKAVNCGEESYPDILSRVIQRKPCEAVAVKTTPPVSQLKAALGEVCPDPKAQRCQGVICTTKDATGNEKPKHPHWMMCDKCHATFTEKGKYVDPYQRAKGATAS